MNNQEIADVLDETARLLELHAANPFKIRSYQSAAFRIDKLSEPLAGKSIGELSAIEGIGESLSQKIHELLETGKLKEHDELLAKTPAGVVEMMSIKGIGPKKVALLWKELQLESIGELLYACNENRLIELKGFGVKTQELIRRSIEFRQSQQGLYRYAGAERSANNLIAWINDRLPGTDLAFTGALRRRCEVVSCIELIARAADHMHIVQTLNHYDRPFLSLGNEEECIKGQTTEGIPVIIHFPKDESRAYRLWTSTGNEEHLQQCLSQEDQSKINLETCVSELEIYRMLGLDYIEPEMREGIFEISLAKDKKLPLELIDTSDLKGILHNHTTYSDGKNTLREMVLACRDRGFEYFGVCDHSKSAGYAGGLSIERVRQQQQEIEELNRELAPFRIFSGIESDILGDGSLDYPDEVLSSFDFVVASVHSGLRMDQDKAMQRLLKAIANPHTTILGHPSGRLLLAREGYPLDYSLLIEACSNHGVVIELNANPYRLDLDWRHLRQATGAGVLISINPDAHSTDGLDDMYYGTCVARKAGLTAAHIFNAFSREEIEKWFSRKKQKTPVK